MANNRFWDDKKLEAMHDTVLPNSSDVIEALHTAQAKWKRKLSRRPFEVAFKVKYGYTPSNCVAAYLPARPYDETPPDRDPAFLQKRIRMLEKEIKKAREESQLAHVVRHYCETAMDHVKTPPQFMVQPPRRTQDMFHGVPTLFLSDFHHGETVYPEQVNGANEFNMEVSRERIERVFKRCVYLIDNVLTPCDYPGIVVPLGGDMVSGNIHEELRESNSMPIFDVVLDLLDILRGGIEYLLDRFPSVYVPCVVGNHGRLDRKPRMKHGPADNYEYILYHSLKRSFADEPRVTIDVSDSFTAHYRIYNTRYLLTHGDQFRGGAGIAGPATPWALGNHKLRKQMASIEGWTDRPVEYDILLIGHFHSLTFMKDMIVNGSTKGFDEYAKKSNFGFEPPQQALWFTTPDRGLSIPMPIFAEDPKKKKDDSEHWVSLPSK